MADLIFSTIGQLIEEKANQHPNQEALVYADRDLRLTYQQLDNLSDKVAKGLMALGIEKGDHLAVWTTNVPEWVSLQFASGKMGAPLVTVNTNYRARELEYLLKQSDSTTLILIEQYRDHRFIDTVYEVCPELKTSEPSQLQSKRLPKLKNVIVLGENRYDGTFNWSDILNAAEQITDEQLAEKKQHYTMMMSLIFNIHQGQQAFQKESC